ncbi:MAG: YceI family protein [Chloroflexi bacterium]|nr:YceI family protein [Chloroflexota bacterium]
MTAPHPSPVDSRPPQRDGLPWIKTILLALVVAVVLAGAFGIWYIFFRGDGPPPVSTGAPVIPGSVSIPAASTVTPTQPTQPATSGDPAAPGTISVEGVWAVDPSIGSFHYAADDFSGSWAGYRVQEELAGIGGTTAVGRTPDISGTLTIAGTQVTAAQLEVDLTTLQSDESMRDGQLGQQGIQTDQFPTATFVLTQPIELGAIPATGEDISFTATGDLTLHGVTKSVDIEMHAALQGEVIAASGSLTFTWDDFGMDQPSSMRVVSLADDVTMEFQVFFSKES